MAKSRITRWITTVLLLAFVLCACDSGAPTATPVATVSNTPTDISQIGNNTPTVESTAEISGPDTPTPAGSTVVGTPALGTPIPTLPPSTPEPPRAPSSLDKIAVALAAGDLDADTALVYQLYAYYLPAKLPAEYQGDDDVSFPEPTLLFARLSERMSSLPAAVQAEAQQFFLRPTNSQSFWYQLAAQDSAADPRGPGLASVAMAPPGYRSKDTPHVRVWYNANNTDSTRKGAIVAADIEMMWTKEKKAMLGREPCDDEGFGLNEDDSRLDLYLVPRTTEVHRRSVSGPEIVKLAYPGITIALGSNGKCAQTAFLLVDVNVDNDHLRSTTAHELFHAFQFSFPRAEGTNEDDYDWWVEGSATWASDLVYPKLNFEQGYLRSNWAFQDKYDGPLDEHSAIISDTQEYAAYIWPFYLRQQAGGDETVVGQLWDASQHEIPIKVMSHLTGWEDRFKEFALWNWNREPVDKYRDAGEHIVPLSQKAAGDVLARTHPNYSDNVDLPKVSVRYYDFPITDLGEQGTYGFVNQVRFDFTNLAGHPELGIQAIIQYGQNTEVPKGYRIEDWSDAGEKVICREVNPVSKVVLVVSNSSIEENGNVKGPIKAEALNVDCPKEASFMFSMDGEYSLDKTDPTQEKGNASIKQTLTSNWDIAFVQHKDIEQSTARTDITSYVFTATNTYEVHMSGNYISTDPFTNVNADLTADGIYTTHSPTQADDDEYKYLTHHSGRLGSIDTYRDRDGKYQSVISFEPPPVALRYEVNMHLVRSCPPNESATYDVVTNEKGVNAVAVGSDDCLSSGPQLGSHKFTLQTPALYGPPPFTPDSASPGDWLITPFDPAKGTIEGELDFTLSSCKQAAQWDTLYLFATLLPAIDRSGLGDDAKGCNISYHAQYRVKLPAKSKS